MSGKLLYLDCPSGLAGDMLLAALCACGADEALIREHLAALTLPGWRMESRSVIKQGLTARKIDFICEEQHSHRHLTEILSKIKQAHFPPQAHTMACRAFTLLAEAEAEAHGCSVDEVHFHEVGAADAILDICGVALALDLLDVQAVYCAPLPFADGVIYCEHGCIPAPAPATLNLLRGFSFYDSGLTGELITPTGAALLRAMEAKQTKPAFTLEAVGLGAGNRELPIANILRVLLGSSIGAIPDDLQRDEVDMLTCNIDDSTGEALGHLLGQLLQAGALDACYIPLTMKKGRPGWQLQVLCPPALTGSLAALVFAESSAIGLRVRRESRLLLPRVSRNLTTPQGEIGVKISGNNIAPEYEDVARAAEHSGQPFKEIYRQALCQAVQEESSE